MGEGIGVDVEAGAAAHVVVGGGGEGKSAGTEFGLVGGWPDVVATLGEGAYVGGELEVWIVDGLGVVVRGDVAACVAGGEEGVVVEEAPGGLLEVIHVDSVQRVWLAREGEGSPEEEPDDDPEEEVHEVQRRKVSRFIWPPRVDRPAPAVWRSEGRVSG